MTRPAPTVTVPVEPTEAMLDAAFETMSRAEADGIYQAPREVWSAMIDAAPAAPQAAGVGELVADLNVLATCDDMEVSHSGGDTNVGDVARRVLNHLRAPSREQEGGAVAWACKTCNSPRAVDPCQKCGTALTKPADGWEWPGLPDIDRIRELAREVCYAIGVHGTMERDLDLIAAPWVAEAVGPAELADHIAHGLGGSVVNGDKQDKPCGRWSCNIHTPDWTKLIDLSVMPPAALATRSDDKPGGAVDDGAFKIATDLHKAYEQLIYGLPKYLDAENLTDEENMIREAWVTLDVTAHRLAALATPACKTCGGKGYTEYEGGEGEGYPSRLEIEACSCREEAPADHVSDARQMVEAPAPTCQKCGGEIAGWCCQQCPAEFRENDDGVLIFDTDSEEAPAEAGWQGSMLARSRHSPGAGRARMSGPVRRLPGPPRTEQKTAPAS